MSVKTIFKTNLVLKKIYTQLLIGLFSGIFFFFTNSLELTSRKSVLISRGK